MTTMKTDGKTFDLVRFIGLLEERRKVVREQARLNHLIEDTKMRELFLARASELAVTMDLLGQCGAPVNLKWVLYQDEQAVDILPDDSTHLELIEACEEHGIKWRQEAMEWVCGCYDNPDDARDALWDILATDAPHETLMKRIMDDVRGLRLHDGEQARRYEDTLLFLQLEEVEE